MEDRVLEQLHEAATKSGLTRAQFLKGAGALVVGISVVGSTLASLTGTAAAASSGTAPSAPPPPLGVATTPNLSGWIVVNADGSVDLIQGKRELGTGVATGLVQIAAEELYLPVASVKFQTVNTLTSPNQGGTDGSTTISAGGPAVRVAAATAYQTLLAMAAKQLGVTTAQLSAKNGTFTGPSGQTVTFASLIGGQQFSVPVNTSVEVKPWQQYTVVGTSVPRLDLPTKFTGAPGGVFEYTTNIRVPGMLHARFMRPPAYGATIVSSNIDAVKKLPGVHDVITLNYGPQMKGWQAAWTMNQGQFVAVVADTEGHALSALATLKAGTTWTNASTLPGADTTEAQGAYIKGLTPVKTVVEGAAFGDVATTVAGAAKSLQASYLTPWHVNGPIGPSVALADVTASKATIYSVTQNPYGVQAGIAAALGMQPSQVDIITYDGSGQYGRTGSADADLEAALLSQQIGRPVRVQWMRAEEFQWGPVRTPMTFDMTGGVDANGNLLAWGSNIYSDSHLGAVGFMFGATYGGAILPPYNVKAQKANVNYVKTALRVTNMRTLGAFQTVSAHEAFIDELAYLAGVDPLTFRLNNLTNERAINVLEAAADKFGYKPHTGPRGNGTGVGVALVVDARAQTYVAHIAEVNVDKKTGQVSVSRVSVAHDCGLMVNPDAVLNQVQGGTIQSLSWTLHEMLPQNKQIVTAVDWFTYPILRYPEVPQIDVTLINRPSMGTSGVGEPASMGMGAVISNGVYDATGVRMRAMPFTPARVLAALKNA